ncbi:AAEL009781-PA [Aedes aegypti]|uniref:AAEL009781-PA n=1 Tax=Aedes aegypti TaxID=7159 RepID=Q16UW8_AEDAE|nr:AAEL009781-PA [Aedes aegypti]
MVGYEFSNIYIRFFLRTGVFTLDDTSTCMDFEDKFNKIKERCDLEQWQIYTISIDYGRVTLNQDEMEEQRSDADDSKFIEILGEAMAGSEGYVSFPKSPAEDDSLLQEEGQAANGSGEDAAWSAVFVKKNSNLLAKAVLQVICNDKSYEMSCDV